ncbi:HAD family hydrolase [Paenibacillus oenotherae]|uniref:HAD family hydrolase n=1 Tax=Paenibacillus oenotherae TaxID=1435645 RepID=A0ABS7D588_9BACL|nr:HAD family hydrolase [Paenibacillus oenotherae]MBW7474717.1 HAD family hydrolase [Paenibacillus oenotherae]
MEFSAVVLDLDGTYLNGSKEVSARNLAAVIECHRRGMGIVFATARPPRAVKWFLPEELLGIGSFVYYNGAQVVCTLSRAEWHESIPVALTADILDYCAANYSGGHLSMEVRDEWYSLKELDYSAVMNARANPVVKPIEELKEYEATKILLTNIEDPQALIPLFGRQVNILVTDNGTVVQIMPKQASKEGAVSELCRRRGIDMKSVIVFGDDHNDIGLFQTCGYSVAMGNAIKELKELADETTAANDEDGVARVLERFF